MLRAGGPIMDHSRPLPCDLPAGHIRRSTPFADRALSCLIPESLADANGRDSRDSGAEID